MITINRILQDKAAIPVDSLTLPYMERTRCRMRIRLDSGREAAVLVERGHVLRGGDLLVADCGLVIEVRAARERVSTAHCGDPLLLARACYHLGNRHVAVQIAPGWLRYHHDHVLDGMLAQLGLHVREELAPFEPESGAYGGHSHGHTNGHSH